MTHIIKPVRKAPKDILLPHLAQWQSNNSLGDLGVARFAYQLLSHAFDRRYGLARWQPKALEEFFRYTPDMVKEDRTFVTATYREGAKTTWFAYAVPLYFILVGQYGIYHKDFLLPESKYIVIRSKTGGEAKKRLMNISVTLNRPIIREYFGDLKPDYQQIKSKEGKDTANLLILNNGYIIESSGMGQPIRGANLFGLRPSIIYDDPEHLENTKTIERREANEMDVYEEAFGAVPSDGFMYYIGNKVHEDDLLGKLLKNETWKRQFHTLTYIDKDGIEKSDWPEKYPMAVIEKRKKWYFSSPKLGRRAYYKNFYNKIVSDVEYKTPMFKAKYHHEFGQNWLIFEGLDHKEYRNVHVVIGNDPAISEKKAADDSAIAVVAFDSVKDEMAPKRRFVLESRHGKFDIHDRYYDLSRRPSLLALTPEELSNVKRIGSVEEIVRLHLAYHSNAIVIETNAQQGAFYNEVRELLHKMNLYPVMMPIYHSDSKENRIREGLLCYYEHGLYYLKDNMYDLLNELNTFPHSGLHNLDAIHLCEEAKRFLPLLTYDPMGIRAQNEKKNQMPVTPPYQSGNLLNDFESWVVM